MNYRRISLCHHALQLFWRIEQSDLSRNHLRNFGSELLEVFERSLDSIVHTGLDSLAHRLLDDSDLLAFEGSARQLRGRKQVFRKIRDRVLGARRIRCITACAAADL